MNIFILDSDMQKNVQYYADKHVVKMITEYAQLLSTAVRLSGINVGYKITHENHPCSIWVRESLSNWLWLKELSTILHSEWQYRYDHIKKHKAFTVIEFLPTPTISNKGLTPFVNCVPEKYRDNDIIESYRNFYRGPKSHFVSWRKRAVPEWFENEFC